MKIERIQTLDDAVRVIKDSGGLPALAQNLSRQFQELENNGTGLYVRYTENFLQTMRVTKDVLERDDIDEIMQRIDTWEFSDGSGLKYWADVRPKPNAVETIFQYIVATGKLTIWTGRQFRLEQTAENYPDDFIFFYANISMEGIE